MTCPNCSKEANRFDDKCLYCGYPFVGDPKQQKKFLVQSDPVKSGDEKIKRKLLIAKVILIGIGAFVLFGSLISYADTKALVAGLIFSVVFITLGFLIRYSPMLITCSLLFVFVGLYLLQSIAMPEAAAKGPIAKATVMALLVIAMITVSDIRKYKDGGR
jgi:hypothetical protein